MSTEQTSVREVGRERCIEELDTRKRKRGAKVLGMRALGNLSVHAGGIPLTTVGMSTVLSRSILRRGLSRSVAFWLVAAPLAFGTLTVVAQRQDTTFQAGRFWAATGGGVAIMGGSLIGLNSAWYAEYDRQAFHGFNDGAEWLQTDKGGHVFSSYWIGRWAQGLMTYSGVPERPGAWVGAATAMVFLGGIEVLDGYSAGWGFSGWDIAANAVGAGVFLGQELAWGQQRIKLKYSVWSSPYAERRPELLGSSFGERVLKDYNGQTLWGTLAWGGLHREPVPWGWLGISVGHGADGMITAEATPGDGRARQIFLSLDVDLERIPTQSRALRTVFFLLNCLKVPAPAIEFRSTGRVLAHGLYY
jgi:hypothetical protein